MSDTATIDRVECAHYHVPLESVLTDSTHGEMTHFGLVTARITDSDGAAGTGYSYTVSGTGASALRALLVDDLAPMLVGRPAHAVEATWEAMWWHTHFVGRGGLVAFATAAIDVALWDLRARRAQLPLWQLLGGDNPRVRAYAGAIDLGHDPAQLREQTAAFLAQGFRAIKTKVGRERLADDVARVAAVRDTIGPDLPLMVDANMRWREADAIRAARALRELDLKWLEEPVEPEAHRCHARIAAEGGIPLATGENLHSPYDFEQLLMSGGVAYPEPDLATLGGITPWLRVAAMAHARQLPVTSHGVHDLHVHLLAAVPNASLLEWHGFGLERFLAEPLTLDDGDAIAPSRPGHGIELDFERLGEHKVS